MTGGINGAGSGVLSLGLEKLSVPSDSPSGARTLPSAPTVGVFLGSSSPSGCCRPGGAAVIAVAAKEAATCASMSAFASLVVTFGSASSTVLLFIGLPSCGLVCPSLLAVAGLA